MICKMERYAGQNHDPEKTGKISGYHILEIIDYGSFGDILKVMGVAENKTYALKQIKFKGSFHDDPYIINEIHCLTHLKHKNLIVMHQIIINAREIDIVLEYAENENLERYIAENNVEFLIKYKVYSQVLQGVEYCHSKGVAHRDLTPGNILLTKDMVVKLADFGLAVKCFSEDDSPVLCNDFLGRASYLAPEVLRQKPFLPMPSDVWSLGVTLIYFLFHSIPYKGFELDIIKDQRKQIWKKFIIEKSDEQHAKLKPCITDFLAHTLELEPSARGTICELVRKWNDVGPETCFE